MNRTLYDRIGKRWLDAACAVLGLLVTAPVFIITAILIRLTSSGPVFFRQERVGQLGRRFRIFKFRTMTWGGPAKGNLVTANDDPRITALGRFLRPTKIDEIPQLLNVLRGEMSFVGPRPEVPEYAAVYNHWQRRALMARPGITGPAAIAFVNEEEILAKQSDKDAFYRGTLLPAKLDLDLQYCENIRFLTDLKLVIRTLARLLDIRRPLDSPIHQQE
jgi:lipopolysaccharide/colanic/teichoic acid biosynthesis glycosyltransferase